MLEARGGRHHLTRDARDVLHGFDVLALGYDGRALVVNRSRLPNAIVGPVQEAVEVHARARGDGERQQNARDGRVHARHEHAKPQHAAHNDVGEERVNVRAVHHQQRHENRRREPEPEKRGTVPVEHRDDQDGDDVVGDGERREEHANAVGHAASQQRHDAEGEGDVGRSRNAPPLGRRRICSVENAVDDDRNRHAAERRDDGKRGLPDVRQLADSHLVFDLKPTRRKNTAMKMSLMMCASDIVATMSPKPTVTSVCQNSRNGP